LGTKERKDEPVIGLAYAKHQRLHVRRCPKRTNLRPRQPGPQAFEPLAFVPSAAAETGRSSASDRTDGG